MTLIPVMEAPTNHIDVRANGSQNHDLENQ
jgi:hypothetical protein